MTCLFLVHVSHIHSHTACPISLEPLYVRHAAQHDSLLKKVRNGEPHSWARGSACGGVTGIQLIIPTWADDLTSLSSGLRPHARWPSLPPRSWARGTGRARFLVLLRNLARSGGNLPLPPDLTVPRSMAKEYCAGAPVLGGVKHPGGQATMLQL